MTIVCVPSLPSFIRGTPELRLFYLAMGVVMTAVVWYMLQRRSGGDLS
ncbi:hypothetical protein GTY41_16865 [Streptomyces sp. SID685]|nr:hypothetical protein [Streptomyces sp. SID685]MYR86563.1 hypothetical protein [Streptomyces sp. SID685]